MRTRSRSHELRARKDVRAVSRKLYDFPHLSKLERPKLAARQARWLIQLNLNLNPKPEEALLVFLSFRLLSGAGSTLARPASARPNTRAHCCSANDLMLDRPQSNHLIIGRSLRQQVGQVNNARTKLAGNCSRRASANKAPEISICS